MVLTEPGCDQQEASGPPPLRVFCAASLSDAVQATAKLEGLSLSLNGGGSNTLVRQAQQGAPADLLLLADDREARRSLEPRGYQIVPLASNRLVVITPASSNLETGPLQASLRRAKELAVADPATAPLGSYTEEALRGLSMSAQVIPLKDAEAVLSAVALSHAGVGIVYRSDALLEPEVRVVCEVPAERHRPILYVAVVPPKAPARSRQLVESLLSGPGREELERRGFLTVAGGASQ